MPVPAVRIRVVNDRSIRADGHIVLYWMTAYRRTRWNFALDHAIARARELRKPLVVLEAIRSGYRWASDRLHRFVLDGMRDNAARFAGGPVRYYPYVEPSWTDGQGLLAALARDACVVVGDDFPAFMLPRMVAAATAQVPVRLELVDANGLLPLRAASQVFTSAHALRRFLQRTLPEHLLQRPVADPLARLRLPAAPPLAGTVRRRWPEAGPGVLSATPAVLGGLPIDHGVAPVSYAGGERAARERLTGFLDRQVARYDERRNQPEADATSRLSPYLHFGHLSVHEVFSELARRERWNPARLAPRGNGARTGWWGMSAPAEAFLDQIVTWRELGFNLCWQRPDYDQYASLPEWARRTLGAHARDRREHVYSLEQFETASTHDPLWNAAQRQLLREGRIHNYLRMLWGKKILEWTREPEAALAAMLELNNRYAVDGRDPNSYSGISWVLGRYDRPWGPERPVFGTVRYMSSASTARKVRVQDYIRAWW